MMNVEPPDFGAFRFLAFYVVEPVEAGKSGWLILFESSLKVKSCGRLMVRKLQLPEGWGDPSPEGRMSGILYSMMVQCYGKSGAAAFGPAILRGLTARLSAHVCGFEDWSLTVETLHEWIGCEIAVQSGKLN